MAFPNTFTNAVDGLTEIEAAHLNNLEEYVGLVGSADPDSLTYKLTNPVQVDPGHQHTAGALSGGSDGDVLYRAAGVWGPGTPDAAGLVAKAGDQSLAGVKTFTSIPVLPGFDPTLDNQAARKAYIDALISSHKHSGLFTPDGVTQTVYVDANGRLGVGVSAPTYELELEKTDANCRLAIMAKGTGQYSILNLGNESVGSAGQVRYDHEANRLEFTTNNVAQRLIVDSSGNVGIKTTSFGASATRTLGIQSGAAPTTSVADVAQLFAADVNGEAGKAGLHLMNEIPAGVKLIVPGVYLKTDTGDPSDFFEGMLVINTFDNTLKIYADGDSRQLASW